MLFLYTFFIAILSVKYLLCIMVLWPTNWGLFFFYYHTRIKPSGSL